MLLRTRKPLLFTAVSGGVWWMYVRLHWELDAAEAASNGTELLRTEAENEHTLLVYGIVSTCVSVRTKLLKPQSRDSCLQRQIMRNHCNELQL